MAHALDTKQYLDTVCAMLREGQTAVPVPVAGVSMRPFLRNGDVVYLDLPPKKLRKGDIFLFTRPNGQYVLHRLHKIQKDGSYLMLGDSQLIPEPVREEQIRAVVTFARIRGEVVKKSSFRWWCFAYPWRWLAPWRTQVGDILYKLHHRHDKKSPDS